MSVNSRDEIRPSKEIWDYYNRNGSSGITIDLIISALADKNYGYHISYSATELLKDLGLLSGKGKVNKLGRRVLAHELHERYHRQRVCHKLINPFTEEEDTGEPKIDLPKIVSKELSPNERVKIVNRWLEECNRLYPNFDVSRLDLNMNLVLVLSFATILNKFNPEDLEVFIKNNSFIFQRIEQRKDRALYQQPIVLLIYFLSKKVVFSDFDQLYPYSTQECENIYADMGISTLA